MICFFFSLTINELKATLLNSRILGNTKVTLWELTLTIMGGWWDHLHMKSHNFTLYNMCFFNEIWLFSLPKPPFQVLFSSDWKVLSVLYFSIPTATSCVPFPVCTAVPAFVCAEHWSMQELTFPYDYLSKDHWVCFEGSLDQMGTGVRWLINTHHPLWVLAKALMSMGAWFMPHSWVASLSSVPLSLLISGSPLGH